MNSRSSLVWPGATVVQVMSRVVKALFSARKSEVVLKARSFHATPQHKFELSHKMEPSCPIPGVSPQWSSLDTAFADLKDDSKIFIQGGAATPSLLVDGLYKYVVEKKLKNVELYHLFTLGPYPFFDPAAKGCFSSRSLFVCHNCRDAVNSGNADFYPIFLSEVPHLFRREVITLDMALISVSPPGRHGYCSLGTSVDITRSAIQNAKTIVGQVNPNVPVTRGDASIHSSHLDYLIYGTMPLHVTETPDPSFDEIRIGKLISENLVDDGATLELGIGSIPQSVYRQLSNHQHLGVHTEMFSDGLVDLVSLGVVTNAHKTQRPGKIVTSFVVGTRKVFDFIDNNPLVDMCDIEWVASPERIALNPKPTCINTCLAIDITGQVASDSIGDRIYSGVGGLVDFTRGAAISTDGKGRPIIGLTSRTPSGEPRIVSMLKRGTGVVLTRAHVHYVVSEYGIAYLFGRNLRQRAYALIQIAHPDDREGDNGCCGYEPSVFDCGAGELEF
ncbi:hypothetical protein P879_02260 [Paragonimus westermani]|uniref:Acetyl-CoA hydrolase n=1 Tax=Paragonimus westermani TaxID=34504 RepID=A0A8T0D656_9TREM|nr:hypothetical protein P879_02260 [Paragonimus westermani]